MSSLGLADTDIHVVVATNYGFDHGWFDHWLFGQTPCTLTS